MPSTSPAPAPSSPLTADPDVWWRSAVIYQIYPRSWADSDGDGIGDLPGVTARLGYLRDLGVDAVWLSPFYPSPQADAGYDVADYRDVDPLFGTLTDADAMLARAHELGLKVIVDLVPNHSSDEHAWFTAALRAQAGSVERDRYLFRDGGGPAGELPPNNWKSLFGGRAWTRVTEPDGTPGQWYLHLFDPKQPDFNWDNAEVRAEFESILRFWLDRGVDGFRVDVAHGLVKEAGLPDWGEGQELVGDPDDGDTGDHLSVGSDGATRKRAPMWDQDGVHEIYEQWRKVLDSYGRPDRILCAEAWVEPAERAVRYLRPTEMNQAFNFDFLQCPWKAAPLARVIDHSLAAAGSVGAPSTWVLSNHDVVRHASRLGLSQDKRRPNGIGKDDVQPDRELGLRRARAATALMLALPGASYIYQGEELGLPESTDMPDAFRQDPTFVRSEGAELGRIDLIVGGVDRLQRRDDRCERGFGIVVARGFELIDRIVRIQPGDARLDRLLVIGVGRIPSRVLRLIVQWCRAEDIKHVDGGPEPVGLRVIFAAVIARIVFDIVHDHIAPDAIATADLLRQARERHECVHHHRIRLAPKPRLHAAHRRAHHQP